MKLKKRLIALVLALVIIVNFSMFGAITAFAHNAMLDVEYDSCIENPDSDGIDEMWYVLDKNSECKHISHNESTIKYYIADSHPASTYTWATDTSDAVAQEIKSALADSMEKWNNVYFYSYNSDGTITKKKIVNVVEGTETDHNLLVYPVILLGINIADVSPLVDEESIESGAIRHNHYSKWMMRVEVEHFYVNDKYDEEYVNTVRERTGAHEIGHILGLRDIDSSNLCHADAEAQHHHELLMGYGSPLENRSFNITYKDIAGVAITRGFHNDSDHKWLNCGLQDDGKFKIICSICNGVKLVDSLAGYSFDTYGACGGNHNLSDGNMMAVASYGTNDYYKCKYCRYVAPFSSNVAQDYDVVYHSEVSHKYVNTVDGLEYSFYEQHTVKNNECTKCGEHIHSYSDHYIWQTEGLHMAYCGCGEYSMKSHVVLPGAFPKPDGYAICMLCRGRVFIGQLNSITSGLAHTDNGSFILTNGIIVLVDEDVQAYFSGTLEFYYGEKE